MAGRPVFAGLVFLQFGVPVGQFQSFSVGLALVLVDFLLELDYLLV